MAHESDLNHLIHDKFFPSFQHRDLNLTSAIVGNGRRNSCLKKVQKI